MLVHMVGQKLQYSFVRTRRIGIADTMASKHPLTLLHRPGLDSCTTSVLALRVQALASPRDRKPCGGLMVSDVPQTCCSATMARQSLHRLILCAGDGRPRRTDAFISKSTRLETVGFRLRKSSIAVVDENWLVTGENIVRVCGVDGEVVHDPRAGVFPDCGDVVGVAVRVGQG